jgi:hypothetical protein
MIAKIRPDFTISLRFLCLCAIFSLEAKKPNFYSVDFVASPIGRLGESPKGGRTETFLGL